MAGRRCQAPVVKGSDFCFAHEPSLAQKRAEWRRAGGKKSGKQAVLAEAAAIRTPAEVKDLLGRTVEGLQRGDIDARTANAVGYLCNLLLKAIKETDLAERLEKLERAVRREGG